VTDRITIILVGEALYGPRFQRELAKDLNVNERTMRRWVAGDFEPPATIQNVLLELLLNRRAKIDPLIGLLR